MCGWLSKSHFSHVKCVTLALLSNAPSTSLWPIKQPSLITNWVYFCLCECNLCISVIRWHRRNHNQAKTRTTVETIDYPSPKPQPKKNQNHNRWIKPGITAEPTPKAQPQPNQSHNRSQNYSQINPTTAAEITLPLPEWVIEITMCQPSAQHTYNDKPQVNRNKQHIKHTAEIYSRTNLEAAAEATTEPAAEPQPAARNTAEPTSKQQPKSRQNDEQNCRSN